MDLGENNFFSTEIGGDHKQVESCETGNTSEMSETFLEALAVEHQGGFTCTAIELRTANCSVSCFKRLCTIFYKDKVFDPERPYTTWASR